MAAPVCLLCSKTTLPQKRVYFRNLSEEPLLSLKQVLTGEYSEETITEHLKEPVIVCKGKCEGLIKKLSKSKVELKKIEAEVLEKMKANFANIPHVNIQQIPPLIFNLLKLMNYLSLLDVHLYLLLYQQ